MKKLITICVVMTMILAISSVANATGTYADLTGRAEYRASTGLTLGAHYNPVASGESHEDAIGYVIANPFQINLLYQADINDSAIDAFNDYGYPTTLNFPDNDYYFLRIDEGGGLPIGIWDFTNGIQCYAPDSGESWVEWTLSYWSSSGGYYQTIFAGDIIDDPYLHVRPTAGFRSFLGEGLANDVEIFDGATIDSEVLGYTFTGDLGEGSFLEPKLVPEPATIALLGLGGLTLLRRKR